MIRYLLPALDNTLNVRRIIRTIINNRKLSKIKADMIDIANQANLIISADDKRVSIKHRLNISDKSICGTLLFLSGGVFFIVASLLLTSDTTNKTIGIVIGLLFVISSILIVIRQMIDGLSIENGVIKFRYNLRLVRIPLDSRLKVNMKTEVMKIRRIGSLGADFIGVTYFLQDENKEIPVLQFQMDQVNADHANKLGNELKRILNATIQQSQP